jgi:hypothetical protein
MESFERFKSSEPSKSANSLPENVAVVDQPEARYRILYEDHRHRREHKAEEIDGVDAVAVEAMGEFNETAPLRAGMDPEFVNLPKWGTVPATDHPEFLRKMVEQDIELFLFDIEYSEDLHNFLFTTTKLLQEEEKAATAVVDAYVALTAGHRLLKTQKLSRRDFIKLSAAGLVGVKGLTTTLPTTDAGNEKVDAFTRGRITAQELLSPELSGIILTLRNALWAYKLKTIIVPHVQSGLGLQKRAEVATIVGAYHIGFEQALRMTPEALLEIISDIMWKLRRVSEFLGIERPSMDIAKVVPYTFDARRHRWSMRPSTISKPLVGIIKEYSA